MSGDAEAQFAATVAFCNDQVFRTTAWGYLHRPVFAEGRRRSTPPESERPMSGTENEAVEAALPVVRRKLGWGAGQLADEAEAIYRRTAQEIYDAMREIIARDVIAGICKREGHSRVDMTPLGSLELAIRCGRCGEIWNEARPRCNPGGPVTRGRPIALEVGEKIIRFDGEEPR